MKAILISPGRRVVELVDVSTVVDEWKTLISADRIDHQTISVELMVVVDDNGIAAELPEFSLYAEAMRTRIVLAGDALVVKSGEDEWADATQDDIEALDVIF